MTTNAAKVSPGITPGPIDEVPDNYVAVVAPMDHVKDAERRNYRVGYAVVTDWMDPEEPGTRAELASYTSLRGAYTSTAEEFRAEYEWESGCWRRKR